jgi:hypothetical protein
MSPRFTSSPASIFAAIAVLLRRVVCSAGRDQPPA